MTKKILLLFLLSPLLSLAQTDDILNTLPWNQTHDKIMYSLVDSCNLSKDQLYKNAQTWFANNTGNYKFSVQMENMAQGKIIAKCRYVDITSNSDWQYPFTISVDVKQNKFRIQIYDIVNHYRMFGSLHETSLEENALTNIKNSKTEKRKQSTIKYFKEVNAIFENIISSCAKVMKTKDDF